MKTYHNIRWGIIGCGDVTEVKSGPPYQQVPQFSLVAVMRRNVFLAKDYAERHQVPCFYDRAELIINDPNIDAIYIATPPDSHKEFGLQVAAAGKICCIEKPLAPRYEDSKAIVSAFERANVPLFVAYYRRSLPRFEKVKALLSEGAIGEVRHIDWQFHKPPSEVDLKGEPNWRTDSDVAPGGYFDDLASHGLDLFAHLLGDFSEVAGFAGNQQGLYSAPDAVTACWTHRSGVSGSAHWNFGAHGSQDEVKITGSEGELSWSVFSDMPIELRNGQGEKHFDISHPKHVQFPHVQNMRDALMDGKDHPSMGASALHTSWVMEQIIK